MKLEKYIADLLYRYDCVIVPNFGGFVANTKSAQVKNNVFTPPFKQITFNSLLVENDGLLANYIASVDKMPYKTAVNFIEFEVQEWIDKLLNEDLELEWIGTLYTVNDTIHFEPNNKVNFLTSSFGLDAVVANQIERQKQELIAENNSVKVVDITSDDKETAVTTTTEAKKSNFLKYAAIFLLGTAVIGYSVKNFKQSQYNKAILAKNIEQQKRTTDKIQQATFVIDTPLPAIHIEVTEKPKNYFIIAGAFRNAENALKKVNELKAKGFDAQIVGKNKFDLTQVAFAGFTNVEEADLALQDIKKNELKDAWLLVKE